jgi:anthranilate phosphoribosyltransferase
MTSHSSIDFPEVFNRLVAGQLDGDTARASFDAILGGNWTPTQIAAFLGAMRVRGETPELIEAAARSMRSAMVAVQHDFDHLLDTCGTGGDRSGSVNLSTGAAIICAACNVPVAKHGNRAASSKAGSADVLEALGIPTDLSAAAAGDVLRQVGITFMMAPTHHPAMRFAGPVRKELKVRTIFNCLGPLANPAGATHQLIGAFADELRPVLAQTLRSLGTQRAWVVRGHDGMDELSPYGPTSVTQLSEGKLEELTVGPQDFGLEPSPADAAKGGDPDENAQILASVLSGAAHPARAAFVLNAAAALVVAEGLSPKEAAGKATEAVDSGAAKAKLEAWRKASTAAKDG